MSPSAATSWNTTSRPAVEERQRPFASSPERNPRTIRPPPRVRTGAEAICPALEGNAGCAPGTRAPPAGAAWPRRRVPEPLQLRSPAPPAPPPGALRRGGAPLGPLPTASLQPLRGAHRAAALPADHGRRRIRFRSPTVPPRQATCWCSTTPRGSVSCERIETREGGWKKPAHVSTPVTVCERPIYATSETCGGCRLARFSARARSRFKPPSKSRATP